MGKVVSETPEFKFALREGLSDEFLPAKADPLATGWDVRAATTLTIQSGCYSLIPLGFRTLSPPGWWLRLVPRSSTFTKKHLHCLYGVLDESWEGESCLACYWLPGNPCEGDPARLGFTTINKGDRIGQIIPFRRQEMVVSKVSNQEIDELFLNRGAERGAGGFGSTGDK